MNRFKRIALSFALVISFIPVKADKYRILYTNSNQIKIGNRTAVRGMIFTDNDEIQWSSEKQAIKVLNLSTKRVKILPSAAFIKHNAKTLRSLLIKNKHLSTRGFGSFKTEVDTICYVLDTLRVDAGWNYGKKVTNKVTVRNGTQTKTTVIRKETEGNKDVFLIPRSAFGTINEPVYVDIFEIDEEESWQYNIYRDLYVVPLPLKDD